MIPLQQLLQGALVAQMERIKYDAGSCHASGSEYLLCNRIGKLSSQGQWNGNCSIAPQRFYPFENTALAILGDKTYFA